MNHVIDIKVTFLTPTKFGGEKIRVFFKDIFNNDVQIDLRPGEVVYSQTNKLSKALIIYSKKGIIKVDEEIKPSFLKYYVGYKQEDIENSCFIFNLQKSLKEDGDTTVAEPEHISVDEVKVSKEKKTIVDKAIENASKYSSKPRAKSKKRPGRPKKRGPKKGSKRKKMEE